MSPEVLVLLPLIVVEVGAVAVAGVMFWVLAVSALRRRRRREASRVESFAVALDARRPAPVAAPVAAAGAAPAVTPDAASEDPLNRLAAEYAAEGWTVIGPAFCSAEMTSTRHGFKAGARRCLTCLHITTTVGDPDA